MCIVNYCYFHIPVITETKVIYKLWKRYFNLGYMSSINAKIIIIDTKEIDTKDHTEFLEIYI